VSPESIYDGSPVGRDAAPPEKRKAVQLAKPVVLLGWNSVGQEVTAHATTVVVGARGCVLRSSSPLPFQGHIALCCNHKDIEGQLRLCEAQKGTQATQPQYVILFDHADPKLWDVDMEAAGPRDRVQVECSACKFCMAADLSDEDELVFLADSAVVLRCPSCRADTRFSAASSNLEVADSGTDPNLVVFGHQIYHMQMVKKEVNERQHRRITTKAKACVRSVGNADDIVDVLDVSRGGLRFQSARNYEQGFLIEVAVHYVEGGNNIFQSAQIARKHRRPTSFLPGEYGVKFVKS
jgi:hypothetical protein